MKTLKAAMQAAVTDIHLDWQLGGSPSIIQVPQQMPPLFGGSRLIVYAILPGKVSSPPPPTDLHPLWIHFTSLSSRYPECL